MTTRIVALVGWLIVGALVALPQDGLAQASRPPVKTTPLGPTIEKLEKSTTSPVPTVPPPAAPAAGMTWVPDRHVPVPGIEGNVWVPGHWERKLSDREYQVPDLVGRTQDGGAVNIPAGTRPPVEERHGP
jgi:hypothetical protein